MGTRRSPTIAMSRLSNGAAGYAGLEELVCKLGKPRAVWVMLPAGESTEDAISQLGALLEPGDTVIDGGNSFWRTISAAPRRSRSAACITWTSGRAGACGVSSAATA